MNNMNASTKNNMLFRLRERKPDLLSSSNAFLPRGSTRAGGCVAVPPDMDVHS